MPSHSQPTAAEFRSQSLHGWSQLWSCKDFSLFGRCQRVLLGRKLRLLSSTFTLDTSAVSLASRQRSIAVFLCSSGGRLFLRIIAPGFCLSEAIATGPRLLLPPPERLMGYGNTTRKLRDNPLFRMDSPQSPSVLSRRTKKDVMIEE